MQPRVGRRSHYDGHDGDGSKALYGPRAEHILFCCHGAATWAFIRCGHSCAPHGVGLRIRHGRGRVPACLLVRKLARAGNCDQQRHAAAGGDAQFLVAALANCQLLITNCQLQHAHRSSVAPTVKPAPTAVIRTRSPFLSRPCWRADSMASGMVPAVVLPNSSMLMMICSSFRPSRSAAEAIILLLAWCGTK